MLYNEIDSFLSSGPVFAVDFREMVLYYLVTIKQFMLTFLINHIFLS